jgi:predicted nucleotidyltransferase
MGKKQIQKPLKVFIRRVKEKYHPQAIILYGSYARDEATEYSDVDLIVIAKSFENIDGEQRFNDLYRLSHDLDPDFHVYGFTPQEAKGVSRLNTLSEALRTGIIIA